MNDPNTLTWRKSSFSERGGACVQVASLLGGGVAIRNSTRPGAGTLTFAAGEMAAWLAACRAGALDDLTG